MTLARAAFEFALKEEDYHQCLSLIDELGVGRLPGATDNGVLLHRWRIPGGSTPLHQFGRAATDNPDVPIRLADLIAAETSAGAK